ncbi:uncharacterized protein EDB91DRAFT_1080816 [Suillus paluster]|uniref:uncharacterized protein n=1 Tax=Suillus paluster TaxID=48578 RepID=UPI001B87B95F|nr:uncharacterized protein EDB91DRAFT_1080816 [Suillus paluster]KAG1743989.1 hypothetical protein EDB91DRAFT_1080816 [Suillus paluster]
MALVSNDRSWWPLINMTRISSYVVALTLAQEVELVWVRYLGLVYAVCEVLYLVQQWTNNVVMAMLGVFVCLSVDIVGGVLTIITTMYILAEEFILSGTHLCTINFKEDVQPLNATPWILTTAWEILALCLAAWIAVKHFRELRQHSTGGIIGDCFTVLMSSHVIYFASSGRASTVATSCFKMGYLSPALSTSPYSPVFIIYDGIVQVFTVVQMFVLGPRLILGIREYHAKLVAVSDTATAMTSIAFQERIHVSTSSNSRSTIIVGIRRDEGNGRRTVEDESETVRAQPNISGLFIEPEISRFVRRSPELTLIITSFLCDGHLSLTRGFIGTRVRWLHRDQIVFYIQALHEPEGRSELPNFVFPFLFSLFVRLYN